MLSSTVKQHNGLLLLKFGGHIVRRTCADSSFQPVSNLAVDSAVNQFQHFVSGRALMFNLHNFVMLLKNKSNQK